jgi:hypothetical protein
VNASPNLNWPEAQIQKDCCAFRLISRAVIVNDLIFAMFDLPHLASHVFKTPLMIARANDVIE